MNYNSIQSIARFSAKVSIMGEIANEILDYAATSVGRDIQVDQSPVSQELVFAVKYRGDLVEKQVYVPGYRIQEHLARFQKGYGDQYGSNIFSGAVSSLVSAAKREINEDEFTILCQRDMDYRFALALVARYIPYGLMEPMKEAAARRASNLMSKMQELAEKAGYGIGREERKKGMGNLERLVRSALFVYYEGSLNGMSLTDRAEADPSAKALGLYYDKEYRGSPLKGESVQINASVYEGVNNFRERTWKPEKVARDTNAIDYSKMAENSKYEIEARNAGFRIEEVYALDKNFTPPANPGVGERLDEIDEFSEKLARDGKLSEEDQRRQTSLVEALMKQEQERADSVFDQIQAKMAEAQGRMNRALEEEVYKMANPAWAVGPNDFTYAVEVGEPKLVTREGSEFDAEFKRFEAERQSLAMQNEFGRQYRRDALAGSNEPKQQPKPSAPKVDLKKPIGSDPVEPVRVILFD